MFGFGKPDEGFPLSLSQVGDLLHEIPSKYFKREGQPTEIFIELRRAKRFKDLEKIFKKLKIPKEVYLEFSISHEGKWGY
jgi:hypothetical protein